MSSPTRDDLLGYLLEALGPHEREQVEARIHDDPHLREEMQRLDACLRRVGLEDAREHYDPPVGLASRTCNFIATQAAQPAVALAGSMSYQAAEPRRRFTWADAIMASAALVVIACVLFPALSYSRFQAQIATCQNQLRQIGFALHGYSDLQPDHSFPGPEIEGPRAAAGVVAPMLVSHKLANSSMFLCPASSVVRESGAEFRIPPLEELDRATGQELRTMQRLMGGDFAYNMGFMDGGKLARPSDARRELYALLADAPSNLQPRRASGNHLGRGQNVLYEDGRVTFLPQIASPQVLDDPYHNRDGWVAAGLDRDDAVLGASNDLPMPVRFISE